MNRQSLKFFLLLLLWQIVRFWAMTLFLASEWPSYVLWFVILSLFADAFAINRCLLWFGLPSTQEKLLPPLGARDPNNLTVVGMVLYLCATAFSASITLINGTQTVLPEGPFIGKVTIEESTQHADGGCFEFSEGTTAIDYLGAVRYSVTARVKEYFYAVPFVVRDWTADQNVAAWAILSESELSSGDFQGRRFAQVVPPRNLHYDAFQLAVKNAEERHAIESDSAAILVRLLDGPPATTDLLSSQTNWIGLIYLLSWLASGPYAAKLFAEQPAVIAAVEAAGASVDIPPVTLRVSSGEEQELRTETVITSGDDEAAPGWMRQRRSWLVLHVGIYAAFAIGLLMTSVSWLMFLFMLPASTGEVWLALRAFRNPEVRASGRMACLMLGLPTSMFFSILILGIGGVQFSESRAVANATQVNITQPEIPAMSEYLELTGSPVLRDDLAGAFWAPSEDARTRWMTPAVSSDWCSEIPVRIWVTSTDRSQPRFAGEPLRYVRRVTNRDSFLRAKAMEDALRTHELTASENVIVVERVASPEVRKSEGGGMVVLGAFCCLLGWCFSACFWPKQHSA